MNKLVIAAVAATTFIGTSASAQTYGTSGTDTTLLRATIAPICTVDAPTGGSLAVNQANQPVGNSAAQCNDPDGFTSTVASTNGGFLKGQANNPTTIPYTISLQGSVQNLPLTNAFTYSQDANQQNVDGYSLPTSISVGTPNGPAYADDYSDVITYTIVAR